MDPSDPPLREEALQLPLPHTGSSSNSLPPLEFVHLVSLQASHQAEGEGKGFPAPGMTLNPAP